jgi:hypothetical protein
VRRAKLNYLRQRVGKATRLVEDRRDAEDAGSRSGKANDRAAGD